MALSWDEISTQLLEPFPPAAVSWRAGAVSRDKKRAQALAYAEPRVYEDRLNEVLGPDWSCRFVTWGEQRLICELSVTVQDGAGDVREITRTSTGEFDSSDQIAQGTAAEAQAFKRACSKFGLGRYLYDLPVSWVGYDESTRRLSETPKLPERSLPAPVRADAKPSTPVILDQHSGERAAEPVGLLLSARRADAMQRELTKLGFGEREQRSLAEKVLGHEVARFSGLTEAEALEVWNVARRSPPKVTKAHTAHTAGF